MKIAVGLSGGVDSSVTAFLLKEAGHDVVGVTMAIWDKELPLVYPKKNSCFGPEEEKEIEKTRGFCKQIGIPFYVYDCAVEYKKKVLEYFKREYLSGRTPNPCITCNRAIKFGALIQAAKESGITFDLFATGHYARLEGNIQSRQIILKKAYDLKKDQSYFLYQLTQEQLAGLFFPLGYYFKEQVREIARKKGLACQNSEESQDFYGGNYTDLLNAGEKEGNIVDTKGNIMGTHKGIWHYTRGQRRGLGVAAGKPLYVIDINPEKNEIVAGFEEDSYNKGFFVHKVHWIACSSPDKEMEVYTKVRSTQKEKRALLIPCAGLHKAGKKVKVMFIEPQKAVSPGQSAVFYNGDRVLGGGVIDEVF